MMKLVDSHAHLDAPELQGRGAELLPAARQAGVICWVIPGVRVSGWPGLLQLADTEQGVFAAPGLHPVYADQWSIEAEQHLRRLCRHPRVVAIGEIGLDGAAGPDRDRQEQVLRAQLQIALDVQLPVLLHARKATGALLEILREQHIGEQVGGVWHGFSASRQVAEELVALGFHLGVGPILLRPSARKLPEAVTQVPAERLLLETDLPDMAECPEVLIDVLDELARLRECGRDDAARVITENARRLFRLDEEQ